MTLRAVASSSAGSWDVYDVAGGGGGATGNYSGSSFDGRYIYFSSGSSGQVMRYDTQGAGFGDASAWGTYTPAGVTGSYSHTISAGGYVYFVPGDGSGQVVRYNPSGAGFDDASSWDTLDLSGIGASIPGGPCGCVGFEWAVFDGRYLYFVPGNDGSGDHGEILRFDTTGDFSDPNDWLMYDVVANGIASGACPDLLWLQQRRVRRPLRLPGARR